MENATEQAYRYAVIESLDAAYELINSEIRNQQDGGLTRPFRVSKAVAVQSAICKARNFVEPHHDVESITAELAEIQSSIQDLESRAIRLEEKRRDLIRTENEAS